MELASEMIDNVIKTGLFNAKWISADSFFGRNKNFLDSVPEGYLYFADVLANMKTYRVKDLCDDAEPCPNAVKILDIAADTDITWNRIILAEGAKGPIIADEKCVRVYEDRDGLPGKKVWLYIRRYTDGKIKCALSNAPESTPITELRRAATMRWPIEQCFEECKDNLGMDHYEGRSWISWHRHMLFVFIAHLFLIEQRLRLKKTELIVVYAIMILYSYVV